MDIMDMVDLICVHDAVEEFEKIVSKIVGYSDRGYSFDAGIVGQLSRVTSVITRNSPIFDDLEDFESQLLGKTLNDRTMSYEERARVILGIDSKQDVTSSVSSYKTKYDAIGEYLYRSGKDKITLRFDQIKGILGFDLPKSAYKYTAWWANSGHSQASAWVSYGYKTGTIRLEANSVTFYKDGKPLSESIEEGKAGKERKQMSVDSDADTVTVCGYDFTFIQDIEPQRDSNGRVIEYEPQAEYKNTKGKRLHDYGDGTFCRFTINAGEWPGVYLWVVDREIVYIGETVKLARRFNTGYGFISGINCYEGGQITNCKMNKAVLDFTKNGKTVKLYFFNTTEYKKVEMELLGTINTLYNVKDN